jgi:rhamnulokinase
MRFHAMLQLLGMEQLGHPTQVGFDRESLVPTPASTALDIERRGIFFTKALIGKRDGLTIIPTRQRAKDVVRLVGGGPAPIDDLTRIVDQRGQLDADKRAPVRLAFLADLLLAAPLATRMDQLDPIGIHDGEECRVGQKVTCLLGIVAQQPLQPRPFGKLREEGAVILVQRAVKRSEASPFERKEQPDGDNLTRIQVSMRPLVDTAANGPVEVRRLHWDVLRLWQEMTIGIARYTAQNNGRLAGIGIDTWAVDFALLDRAGRLLGNPYHYRDRQSEGMLQVVDRRVPPERLYAQTGIQRLPINTLYQLVSMRQNSDPQLDVTATLLLIPDLFHYWLTGRTVAEYTNATTTQFFDARARGWATDLIEELGLPTRILSEVVAPGTMLGGVQPDLGEALGLRHAVPVIATATHDTASAVAGISDLDERCAYISSGTWSLVGVELDQPILSEQARALNFTNEGGVAGTIRFLKNVGGLWLLQECQRQWQRTGQQYSWPELVTLAEAALPLRSLVDPDAPDFLNPDDMPLAIRAYCRRTSQSGPESVGALVRCCLESLALNYRWGAFRHNFPSVRYRT